MGLSPGVRATYPGILFPDRAEDLQKFVGYRVFLDHWDDLSHQLKGFYEEISNRGVTRALTIFGRQGTGKTLFADQLDQTFHATKQLHPHELTYEQANLWHRISGGPDREVELVAQATASTELVKIENEPNWVDTLVKWHGGRRDRVCIAIADNAERTYFRQGMLGLGLSEYLSLESEPRFMTVIAQKFVDLCRRAVPSTLFLVLSNDEAFLTSLNNEVGKQHEGLMDHRDLPLPSSADKEHVVRVNTNRLNNISYWFCLDKAGIEGKKAVRSSLMGANNFPDSFKAVDAAVKSPARTRIGRPGKRNLISLVALYQGLECPSFASDLGQIEDEEFLNKWGGSFKYRSGWAQKLLSNPREAGLLESEWQLRIVFLGSPFVSCLLRKDLDNIAQCRRLLDIFRDVYGPGTHNSTREDVRSRTNQIVDSWVSPDDDISWFWNKGQTRSVDYESALRMVVSDYNRSASGFLNYRPDCIISPYRPCSILSAHSDTDSDINEAIRRDCHVFEFSAFKEITSEKVLQYLAIKAKNYLELTQEQ